MVNDLLGGWDWKSLSLSVASTANTTIFKLALIGAPLG
jgi:hypothetical protein